MILLEERFPQKALDTEAVLHVRRHLRRQIQAKRQAYAALTLLFDLTEEEAERLQIERCLREPDPIRAAAQRIGTARGTKSVSLAYEEPFVARCRTWLLKRKQEEPAFERIIASDLRTLLELSKARDFAFPEWAGNDHEQIGPPILILGETGTGKELMATAIHEIWCRQKDRHLNVVPMKVLHVAGKPGDIITDEFFGHVKGAYTGADKDRKGRLEEADGSSLLIDEVGDLPSEAQVQLLRFLQDQKLSRHGDNQVRQVQVRILAATLHDLDRLVADNRFRLDLLHRLRVGMIRLPPLREREDAFREVLPQMLTRLGQQVSHPITRSARDALAGYSWPGNLRELDGVLQTALISSHGETIRLEDLPAHIQSNYLGQPAVVRIPGILLDDLEGQSAGPTILRERVAYASTVLGEELQQKGFDAGHWAGFASILRAIPDKTDEHRQVISTLQELSRLEKNEQLLEQLKTYWLQTKDKELPEDFKRPIEAEVKQIEQEIASVSKELQQSSVAAGDLARRSPWFRIFLELEKHPIREHIPNWGAMIQTIVTGIQLLSAFSPDAVTWIRNSIVEGGLDGLKKSILEQMSARNNEAVEPEYEAADEHSTKDYKSWPAEEWKKLAIEYSSFAEIQKKRGIDPKTVKAYFVAHSITPGWPSLSRSRPALPAKRRK